MNRESWTGCYLHGPTLLTVVGSLGCLTQVKLYRSTCNSAVWSVHVTPVLAEYTTQYYWPDNLGSRVTTGGYAVGATDHWQDILHTHTCIYIHLYTYSQGDLGRGPAWKEHVSSSAINYDGEQIRVTAGPATYTSSICVKFTGVVPWKFANFANLHFLPIFVVIDVSKT